MGTELEQSAVPGEAPKIVITGVDEYDRATQRVAELAGCIEDSPEERELQALIEAIAVWDRGHDDATGWKD